MIYLGLDYGSKTLGLAISDKTALIATSLDVLRYTTLDELFDKLDIVVKEKNVDAFVLGNPLNLDGSFSKRCEETQKFKELLEKRYNKKIYMQDERLSTVEAQNLLISNSTRRKKRKKVVDKIAATIILQSYLDRSNNEK